MVPDHKLILFVGNHGARASCIRNVAGFWQVNFWYDVIQAFCIT